MTHFRTRERPGRAQTSPDRTLPMMKRKWLFGVAALALIGIVLLARDFWTSDRAAAARAQGEGQAVPVEVGKAERRQVPVRVDALGTVTTVASVAIKPRIDTTIEIVNFQ